MAPPPRRFHPAPPLPLADDAVGRAGARSDGQSLLSGNVFPIPDGRKLPTFSGALAVRRVRLPPRIGHERLKFAKKPSRQWRASERAYHDS